MIDSAFIFFTDKVVMQINEFYFIKYVKRVTKS